MELKVGSVVRIIPEWYLQHAPLDVGVVERWSTCNCLQFQVGFPMFEKKLWLTCYDVEVVGQVEV